MSCTKCNNTTSLCKEEKCTGCQIKNFSAECVNVYLEEFPCSGIPVPNTLDQVLLAMDEFICNKVDSVSNFISLTNVGGGSEIYAGDDNLGRKKLRTLTSSDNSVTITQGTDTVDLTAGVAELESIGTGNDIYITPNQISSIKDLSTTGFTPLYNGYTNGDHEFSGISSSTIEILKDSDGNIIMNTPPQFISGVPKYIVNNGYTGTVEDGSEVRPFKTVDGAVAKFVGTGDRNNPENQNAIIEIQQGIANYTYGGDFTYRNLNIVIKAGATLIHQPSDFRKIMDLDALDNNASIENSVYIEGEGTIILRGDGFSNAGGISTALRKTISLTGAPTGLIRMETALDPTRAVFNMNPENSSVPQQGSFAEVLVDSLDIRSEYNPMLKLGGHSSFLATNGQFRTGQLSDSGTGKPYQQTGGSIIMEDVLIVTYGIVEIIFDFNMDTAFNNSTFDMTRCIIQPQTYANSIFHNSSSSTATYKPDVKIRYSTTRYGTLSWVFRTTTLMWREITCIYNTFNTGALRQDESIDLNRNNTISVHNFVGGNLIENLVSFGSRTAAQTAGLPINSKFLNRNDANPSTNKENWFVDISLPPF